MGVSVGDAWQARGVLKAHQQMVFLQFHSNPGTVKWAILVAKRLTFSELIRSTFCHTACT